VAGPGHLTEMDQLWVPLLAQAGLDTTDANLGLLNDRLPATVLEALLDQRFAHTQREDLVSLFSALSERPQVGEGARL